jgi:hypothetical protein
MTEEAENALKALARLPIRKSWGDDHIVYELDGQFITAGHVRDARTALYMTDGISSDTARMMVAFDDRP